VCYDTDAMRTTLAIEDDALGLARRMARRKRLTLGQAVSELVRRGARQETAIVERHGLAVVQLPRNTPGVSRVAVDSLLDEQP
jgi:hypothetical protein